MMEHIEVEIRDGVGWVWINRAEKKNAMSADMWSDLPAAVEDLSDSEVVRVVVVAGRGDCLTVGIDLGMLMALDTDAPSMAVSNAALYRKIKQMQYTMTAFADCPKPTIAAIHGYCLGAGVDLITACDIRLSTEDAVIGVRETRMGLVADVGTMQRLPKIVSPGHVAELVFGGEDISGAEAARIGLVNRTFPSADSLFEGVARLAERIAANSPLVVQGAKAVLRAEAGMSESSALDHMALWNAAFLKSNDLMEAMAAQVEKRQPDFSGT